MGMDGMTSSHVGLIVRYVQYMLGLPLLLYLFGSILQAYLMLATSDYSPLFPVSFQLMLALIMLLIPFHAAARITSVCREIAVMATSIDMCDNLMERTALIQQLVLLPTNGNIHMLYYGMTYLDALMSCWPCDVVKCDGYDVVLVRWCV